MKKIYLVLTAFLFALIFSVSSFIYWFQNELKSVSNSAEKVSFVVDKGKTATQIGEQLYSKNLIRNRFIFKLYVQFFNKSKNINAGEFELSPSMSVSEIVNVLGRGPKELLVTIPEGLRREEVADRIIQSLQMDKVKGESFRSEFLALSKSSEGYLFPDSYFFPRDVSAETIYEKLRSTFDENFDNKIAPLLKEKTRTKNEIVTMASILERETKTDAERPIVSGILWKRIENGWPLQVDATVQYAVSSAKCQKLIACKDWWPVLSLDDLEVNSPFNTYKIIGLPPMPISSPGLKSLVASVDPQTSDYWYYIHANGQIYYAKTQAEHSANVRKYLGK